jgi:hypothetical protein
MIVALLACGGYAYELSAHLLPHGENAVVHEHSAPDGNSGCHHCTCHCPPTAVVTFDALAAMRAPICVGDAAAVRAFVPEAIPLGIDHPPQLACLVTRAVVP